MHTEYFLILLPFLLALALVALCCTRGRLRKRAALQMATPSTPRPLSVKCHIKTFAYRDGHSETRHSVCNGLHLDALTDDAAQQFHPESKLIHVGGSVHEVQVK